MSKIHATAHLQRHGTKVGRIERLNWVLGRSVPKIYRSFLNYIDLYSLKAIAEKFSDGHI